MVWFATREKSCQQLCCVYTVEYLHSSALDDIRVSPLKLVHGMKLNSEAIRSHILTSKTGIIVSRVLGLDETSN